MSKDYLLGIDIGTSACKVAVFGGMRFAALFANAWRQVIFQESRLPEWELMGRAGRLLPLTMREMF